MADSAQSVNQRAAALFFWRRISWLASKITILGLAVLAIMLTFSLICFTSILISLLYIVLGLSIDIYAHNRITDIWAGVEDHEKSL